MSGSDGTTPTLAIATWKKAIPYMREFIFSIATLSISRALLVRDVLLGRIARGPCESSASLQFSRHSIPSRGHMLDAVLAKPAPGSERAALLICHGIGETVDHWRGVQRLLAQHGVVSLVFDYSGYGRSAGIFTSNQSERDAIAAFRWLGANTGIPDIALLGFSLGCAIAASIVSKVPAQHLVLCSAFTSLREAAISGGVPRRLTYLLPPIWHTVDLLPHCRIPVLILHGDQDRLFPIQMASDLKAACGSSSRLVLVKGHSHDEAYRRPQLSFWGDVVSYLLLSEERFKQQLR
jgi:pimeloyl-ACP methyl ester carboxylesterase